GDVVAWEDVNERALRELLRAEPSRNQREAGAREREVAKKDAVGGRDARSRTDLAYDAPPAPELPGTGELFVREHEARLASHRPRLQRRTRDTRRARDHDARHVAELLRNEAERLYVPQANGDIDPLGHEVRVPRFEDELDFDTRFGLEKPREPPTKVDLRER